MHVCVVRDYVCHWKKGIAASPLQFVVVFVRLQCDWLVSVSNDTTVHVQDVDQNMSRFVSTLKDRRTHTHTHCKGLSSYDSERHLSSQSQPC